MAMRAALATFRKIARPSLACAALALSFLQAPTQAAFTDLVSLGSSAYTIDGGVTTATYTQDATGTRFSPSVALGDTLGGVFTAGPLDWSAFSDLNSAIYLKISFTGANPLLPISLLLFNSDLSLSMLYSGTTAPITESPSYFKLDLVGAPTATVLSGAGGAQITWDGGATVMNANVEAIAVASPTPTPPSTGGSFTARAPGGVRFITSAANAPYAGAEIQAGQTNWTEYLAPDIGASLEPNSTSWASLSDSNAKTAVTAVDHRTVLRKVSALPITTWQYKHDPNRRYVGPMAQDFHGTFGLGHDDKHISTLDTDGVTLSALKGLIAELQQRQARSTAQARRLQELQAELESLQKLLRMR